MKHKSIVGIGFGPSNLSTAVALHEAGFDDFIFLEKRSSFAWHPEMLLKESRLQNSFLKDLITMQNPKSHFTFLNYLFENKRLDDFVNLRSSFPCREEVTDYMRWAAQYFDSHVHYDAEVRSIFPLDGGRIGIEYYEKNKSRLTCDFLIIGAGQSPFIPQPFLHHYRATHTSEMLSWLKKQSISVDAETTFLVVGGGQSSAEVVYHLLVSFPKARVEVVSRRFIYKSLEESAFINNLFSTKGMDWFFEIAEEEQKEVLDDLYEANYSAVDSSLIMKIYELIYHEKRHGVERVSFHPYCKVAHVEDEHGEFRFNTWDRVHKQTKTITAHYAIYATGYTYGNISKLLTPFQPYIACGTDNHAVREKDFSLKMTGGYKIYAHAVGDARFGFTEGGMTNLAQRSQRIVEAIAKQAISV